MHILMTGGTGYLGGAVAEVLAARGHRVRVVTRRPSPAPPAGVEHVAGDLTDPDGLAARARDVDAVVFAAWELAPDGGPVPGAVSALLDAVAGRDVPFLLAGSSIVYGDTGPVPVAEDAPLAPPPFEAWRAAVDRAVLTATADGRVRGAVVRPALVYGRGGNLLLRGMVDEARTTGTVHVVAGGGNRFSTVHVDDLAVLHALALEAAATGATGVYHAATGDIALRDLAAAAGHAVGTGGRVASRSVDEAAAAFGVRAYAEAQTHNSLLDTARTREVLGWRPTGASVTEYLAAEGATLPGARPATA